MHILVRETRSHKAFLNFQRLKHAAPDSQVMSSFHTEEYVHYLHIITADTAEKMAYQGVLCMSFLELLIKL